MVADETRVDVADDDLSAGLLLKKQQQHMALPLKEIPGSYGVPFISAIKDRLDFYYVQGQDGFFQARVDKYSSTVFRANMPPGPIMAKDPRVIVLLDAKSFPVLFDALKVEKRDVFTGTYMPSTSLTGGYRACAYLDTLELDHARIKQFLLNLLSSRSSSVIPSFRNSYAAPLFADMEAQLAAGGKSDFNSLNDSHSFEFLGDAYFGVRPSTTALGDTGPSRATKWLFFQLAPLLTVGLPKVVEEIFLHTFPLPPFLVKADYDALYKYFSTAASAALDSASQFPLFIPREEACHNLLFATCFNTYGGIKVLFPGILKWVALAGAGVHARLAAEARAAVAGAGGGKLNLAALEKMELVHSVVYESLRLDPPVKFQYGRARMDLVIESHDASFNVKAGEMLFGYQPFATRDPVVFGANAGEFVADRFVGDEGKKLLQYVVWSNAAETRSPTAMDKQCPGKDFVGLIGRLLVAELFLRYDTFTADVGTQLLGAQVTVTSLTKAKSAAEE